MQEEIEDEDEAKQIQEREDSILEESINMLHKIEEKRKKHKKSKKHNNDESDDMDEIMNGKRLLKNKKEKK